MIQKPTRIKNVRYRRFVAAQDCFSCGVSGFSQCAHRNGGGMGTKHSDYETFPLCCTRPGYIGCHPLHDTCFAISREERKALEDAYVERMQNLARAAGWML